jgi:uncharacterized short protein YbdD (DUF466 family)
MICTCFGKTLDFTVAAATARAVLGLPDYNAYLAHLAQTHPDLSPPDKATFFRTRQAARFGTCGFKCC